VDILVLDARPTHRIAFLDGHPAGHASTGTLWRKSSCGGIHAYADLIARHEYRLTGPGPIRATSRRIGGSGNPGAPLDELRRAAQENPQNTMAWLGLAQEYQVAGLAALAERVDALSHAVPLLPGNDGGACASRAAEAFLQMGRHADAVVAAQARCERTRRCCCPTGCWPRWRARRFFGDAGTSWQALLKRISADHPMAPQSARRLQAVEGG